MGHSHLVVETVSVFSPTPVVRKVTLSELMDIYDLELGLQAELSAFWSSQQAAPLHAFVLQPPTKALFS